MTSSPADLSPGTPRGRKTRPDYRPRLPALLAVALAASAGATDALAQAASPRGERLQGAEAMGEWRSDRPGLWRHIRPGDLPAPYATQSTANQALVDDRPEGATPKAPPGYKVELWASGLQRPRTLRTAPNGDVFVAETAADRVSVLRPGPDGKPRKTVFASGLNRPFGIAFHPAAKPEWVYVANTDSVVRFRYKAGDAEATGKPEVIVASLPTGGHSTRDVAFSPDGRRMFVSVGSRGNVAEGSAKAAEGGPPGALAGDEAERAAVLAFDPAGKGRRIFATGIRNCVGLAVHPATGDLWCSTNERDGLGDDLVPDYLTRVKEGGFYGWPWFYLGANPDPRHKTAPAGLEAQVTVPDVLIQAHSASLGMTFYTGTQFPQDVRGDAFAAQHGSWNRSKRTGYKVIRAKLKNGVPTGEYQDFLTGFVIDDKRVWGRPVGITVAADGALLVSEDGNGTVWRVTWTGEGVP